MPEELVLVDEDDNPIGKMEKIETHRKGILHRAFSVFIFNSREELLVQRRAEGKYHSPGLWSNSCDGHPTCCESLEYAARRRIKEELGLDCRPEIVDRFVYRVEFENGLTEHEYDYILIGHSNAEPIPDPQEVDQYQWIEAASLLPKIETNPQAYCIWFKLAIERLIRKNLFPGHSS